MTDHRIINANGNPLDFTCENSRFITNINLGYIHKSGHAWKGSVTEKPLFDNGQYTLWLEHVVDKKNNDDYFWFMWYNDGKPTIPLSGVMEEEGLINVINNIKGVNF